MPKKMRAIQVVAPKGQFQLVELDVPEPTPGTVRVKVQACGICHSDLIVKEGLFPGIAYPRVPGHEVAGVVDAVGAGVTTWKVGQRVGVGWHGGFCAQCDNCRRGDFFACVTGQVTGLSFDGGYADYMIAPASAVALIPDDLPAADAAPLCCAGITTYNALRNSGARPGDLVAILGIGGLGHLAVQFAAKMGYRTVALARGADKGPLVTQLGAWRYIDTQATDPSEELQKLGGARAIVATVTSGDAMAAVQGGLAPNGTLMLLGAAGPMQVEPLTLLMGRKSIKGWYSGTSIDTQETLNFSSLTGVRSMNETLPLERAAEGFERMVSGKARFRVVLTTGN